MARIGLVIRPGIEEALAVAVELKQWAHQHGHKLVVETSSAQLLLDTMQPDEVSLAEELVHSCEPIVSLGGDGTLIGVARYVGEHSPVMIGVNFGTLGFLTEIAPEELHETVELFFDGKARSGTRSILKVSVTRSGTTETFSSQAINDVAVLKSVLSPLPSLDLSVDDKEVMRLRGDGVIVATPTGSTAYSLAAGGSIVHPDLEACLVTPVCPHSLTNRPLILPLDSVVGINIPPHEGEIYVVVDGQVTFLLETGDLVQVTRSPHKVRFVRSPHRSYFEILRAKLNWGIANQSG
jgi:NAD+ kinase